MILQEAIKYLKRNTSMNDNNLKSFIILFKAYQSIVEVAKKSISSFDLSLNEFTVLEALYNKESLTTQELINTVLIPNSSMTYVLEQLEKKELIIRKASKEDKRKIMNQLTDNRKKEFGKIYEDHFKDLRPIFDTLSIEEEKTLQKLLKTIGKEAERINHET